MHIACEFRASLRHLGETSFEGVDMYGWRLAALPLRIADQRLRIQRGTIVGLNVTSRQRLGATDLGREKRVRALKTEGVAFVPRCIAYRQIGLGGTLMNRLRQISCARHGRVTT